jgi:hypothetical protein
VSAPPGIAHLEDPKVLDDLALAQGQLSGQMPADAPMTLALVVSNRISGLLACAVLASWRWWLGLGMLVVWMAVRHPQLALIREQGPLYAGSSETLRRAWYLQRLAATPDVAKGSRVFGLGGWLVDRYRSTVHDHETARRETITFCPSGPGSWTRLAGDDGHLDQHAGHQVGPDRGAHRLGRAGKRTFVGGVERFEQGEIGEVHQARHDVIQASSGRAQQGLDVAEHLRGLAGYLVADQLASGGIESALARQEDQVADDQSGRVRAGRRRSPGGADEFLHWNAPSWRGLGLRARR